MFLLILLPLLLPVELTKLRTSDNADKYRIVFDISGVKELSFFKNYNNKKLSLTLQGTKVKNLKEFEKSLKKIYLIKSFDIIELPQEKELILDFLFEKNYEINTFSLNNPTRLVVDVLRGKK